MTALTILLGALATYRLTLLVISDTLTEPPREALIKSAYRRDASKSDMTLDEMAGPGGVAKADYEHDGWKKIVQQDDHPPKFAYLITCPWCSSVYVAIPVALAAWRWGGTGSFDVPAALLSFSAAAGFLSKFASS